MEDLFKKFVNAGVGFVSLTNERVQKSIDALVKESKLSEKEGAKIMDDLKKNTDTKRKELEKQAKGLADRLMKTVGVAPNSEVEELKRTVKNTAKKPAAKSGKAATGDEKMVYSTKTGSTASPITGAVKKASTKSGSTASKSAAKAKPSATEKANITAAKKAISPNDNTSTAGSSKS